MARLVLMRFLFPHLTDLMKMILTIRPLGIGIDALQAVHSHRAPSAMTTHRDLTRSFVLNDVPLNVRGPQ